MLGGARADRERLSLSVATDGSAAGVSDLLDRVEDVERSTFAADRRSTRRSSH